MTPYFKMALGEVVGEGRSKITTMRVLPDGKMEVSQQGTGKLLESEISDAATYWTVMRPNGSAYGEGQQAIMSSDGSAVWKGSGVGKPIGQGGGWKYGVVGAFQTVTSQKWGRLFDVCTVEEYDVDQNQNYHWKMWEWKY
jgi:hypothetical protein